MNEQLLQMPAVHTDRFSITGFLTFTAQGTVLKQILQKLNQTQVISTGASVTILNTLYTLLHILYTIHYTQYPI